MQVGCWAWPAAHLPDHLSACPPIPVVLLPQISLSAASSALPCSALPFSPALLCSAPLCLLLCSCSACNPADGNLWVALGESGSVACYHSQTGGAWRRLPGMQAPCSKCRANALGCGHACGWHVPIALLLAPHWHIGMWVPVQGRSCGGWRCR